MSQQGAVLQGYNNELVKCNYLKNNCNINLGIWKNVFIYYYLI